MITLTDYLRYLGRFDEALDWGRQTLALSLRLHGELHPDTVESLRALGTIELRRDALPEAMALLERALDGTRRIYGDEHLRVAYLRANLGPVHYQTGDYARAEALTRQAMPVFELRLGAEHPRTAFLMENLANAVLALGRHDEALGLYQRSIELLRRKLGPDHVEMGHSAGNMAGVYARLNRHADMLPCSLESVRVLEKALGADTPRRLIGGSRRTRTCSRRAALTTPTPAPQRAACRKCSSGWGPAEAWPATARGASGPLIAPRPGPGSARGCGV